MNRHLFASTVECAVFVIAVDAGQWRIGNHVVCQMPFAKVCRRVSAITQHSWKRGSVRREPIGHVAFCVAGYPSKVTVDVVASREMSRHDRGPARRTDTTGDSKTMKVRALLCQPIDVRCLDIRVTVATKITPAPIV